MGELVSYLTDRSTAGSLTIEKRFNVNRVPTLSEVQEFFGLMRYGSKWHAWFSLTFLCGLRPCEIVKLTTDMIECDESGNWVCIRYEVGKPKPPGRPKKGEKPKPAIRKWNRIDERLGHIPCKALDSLKLYWNTNGRRYGLLFPNTYIAYGKEFSKLRTKMINLGHTNWSRTSDDYFRQLKTLRGGINTEHDITPYSGRRFFISCYHWLVSSENRNAVPDLIETQKRMAHSGNKDTMIYVHTWRQLGIEPKDIGRGWEVLTGGNPKQRRLNEWTMNDEVI